MSIISKKIFFIITGRSIFMISTQHFLLFSISANLTQSTIIVVVTYSLINIQLVGTNVYTEGNTFKVTTHLQFFAQSKVERVDLSVIGKDYS